MLCQHEENEAGNLLESKVSVPAGKPYRMGRLGTVDLLVLTTLDELPLILQTFTQQGILMRRPNHTESSPSVSVPWKAIKVISSFAN